jgi:hypothetical protein
MTVVSRDAGGILVALVPEDALLLRSLASQVVEMLRPDEPASADPLEEMVGLSQSPAPPPTDPAVQRLLPDAYAEQTAATEFRRLMDVELRRIKVAALDQLLADLDDGGVRLDDDGAEQWLQALNDLRLVLGVRLDVQEDLDEFVRSLPSDDARLPLLYAYDRVTRLQDALLGVIDG